MENFVGIVCFIVSIFMKTDLAIPLPGLDTNQQISNMNEQIRILPQSGGDFNQLPAQPKPHNSDGPSKAAVKLDLNTLQHMSAIQFLSILNANSHSNGESSMIAKLINQIPKHQSTQSSEPGKVSQSIHGEIYRPNGEIVAANSGPQQPTEQQNNLHFTGHSLQQPIKLPTPVPMAGASHYSYPQHSQLLRPGNSGKSQTSSGYNNFQQSVLQQPGNSQISGSNNNQPRPGMPYQNGPNSGASSTNQSASYNSEKTSWGIGMGSGFDPNSFNQVQMNMNPMNMLAPGMGSGTSGTMQYAMNDKNPDNGKIKGPDIHAQFNPDKLMNSLLSSGSSNFNPDKFTTSQKYVSTSTWNDAFAGKPTGYSGLFVPDESKQTHAQQSEQGKTTSESQQQTFPNQYLVHMNFAPMSMIMPGGSPVDNKNIKFDFNPDNINSKLGTFHPGMIAPMSQIPKGDLYQSMYNADKLNEKLMGIAYQTDQPKVSNEVGEKIQQQQQSPLKHRILQLSPFRTPDGSNNMGSPVMQFPPQQMFDENVAVDNEPLLVSHTDFIPGRLFPGSKNTRNSNNGEESYSPKDVVKALIANMGIFRRIFDSNSANQQQSEQHRSQQLNVSSNASQVTKTTTEIPFMNTTNTTTVVQSTSLQPTTGRSTVSAIQITSSPITTNLGTVGSSLNLDTVNTTPGTDGGNVNPHTVNTGQLHEGTGQASMFGYGSPGNFNPNVANQGSGFNPAMSPGMSAMSFAGMQFGQLGPIKSNSTGENQFGFIGNFNPSKLNNAHMSFDMNAQMGIMGSGSGSSFDGHSFSGGYDPIQANIMAIKNPFSSDSNNGTTGSNNFMSPNGNSNAFMKPFNPNSVNQALMNPIQSNHTNGGDFTSFYLGLSGGNTMSGQSGFGGTFDPATVNTAVFDPDQVNKVQMHFDPSEMLEKNPGYDKNTATSYKFDANKVNQMHGQNFAPSFLGGAIPNSPGFQKNTTNANAFTKPNGFLPELLTGGNMLATPFDPNQFNNLTISLPNPMENTNQHADKNSTSGITFDPIKINNFRMNFNTFSMMHGGISKQTGNEQSPLSTGKIQEFNTNHEVPDKKIPKLQGGDKGSKTASQISTPKNHSTHSIAK